MLAGQIKSKLGSGPQRPAATVACIIKWDSGPQSSKMPDTLIFDKICSREGEKWQDAVKRASAMIRKDS